MLLTKRAYQCTVFQTFSALKVDPILYAIFEPQGQGLFKFCITVQCLER